MAYVAMFLGRPVWVFWYLEGRCKWSFPPACAVKQRFGSASAWSSAGKCIWRPSFDSGQREEVCNIKILSRHLKSNKLNLGVSLKKSIYLYHRNLMARTWILWNAKVNNFERAYLYLNYKCPQSSWTIKFRISICLRRCFSPWMGLVPPLLAVFIEEAG